MHGSAPDTAAACDGPRYSKSQFLWDSGAAVLSNAHRNATRAALELETLLQAQQPDGRVPEIVQWPAGTGDPKTQMPVLAWVARAVYNRTQDLGFLRRVLPPLVRYWQWWRMTRDIDGDGLVTILHPW